MFPQPRGPPQIKIRFRVLIIGRANAGKTSILQRVCGTTQSPVVYRRESAFYGSTKKIELVPSMERGEHRIEDEIYFSNHDGYIFHDSRGFESGSVNELEIVQNFVRQKSGEKRLRSKLHAIWYCIPMDNQRPELDLKYFKDICPDKNVPVIGVFTKYDQFVRNVKMELEDHGDPTQLGHLKAAEIHFQKHYLCHLGDEAKFVRLEKMHKANGHYKDLIEKTAGALNEDVVTLMIISVQRNNLELSVKVAVEHVLAYVGHSKEFIVKQCLIPFPHIWPSSQVINHLAIAAIIIFKHATTLRLLLPDSHLALHEAESKYLELKIGNQIAQHFTAPFTQYSAQHLVDFIMGISVSVHISTCVSPCHSEAGP
ncbi:hypothetical protein CVT25_011902 [Psilocybe cyanescens]|uniref:Uncharacterized protein n=1 Tax=Psilocybe cyanescens TaxID=93625 RepID=A0A409XUT7_PSICY|nr:hypothetical protein CVT25_011902 [Psilocybe cyanescens]